jgi:rhodanese-related sulfurtransferase
MASHAAARRAVAAGYKDVAVMADGIVGWFALRQPIRHVSDAEAEGKSS